MKTCNIPDIKDFFFRRVDASSLGLFRLVFGLILAFQALFQFNTEFVQTHFIKSFYHFPFALFDIIPFTPFSPETTQLLFTLMGISALTFALGLAHRTSAAVFFFSFLYMFLYEKTLYNDHYYLILLLMGLFLFMECHKWPILNQLRLRKITDPTVPYWHYWIIRTQFIIVYAFSLVSKLSYDWLILGEPMGQVLKGLTIGGISLDHKAFAIFFSYAGLFLVAFIVAGLIIPRWRKAAFAAILAFHLANHFVFFKDIGWFPFIMISGIIPFWQPDAPRKFLNRWRNTSDDVYKLKSQPVRQKDSAPPQDLVLILLGAYLLVQILVPLRQFLYPGNPAWTFEGGRFAWRLKLHAKHFQEFDIHVIDPQTGRRHYLHNPNLLTANQHWINNIPDALIQYIYILRTRAQEAGINHPIITIRSSASLNGRPYQPYIKPDVNMAEVEYPLFSHADWIEPLR